MIVLDNSALVEMLLATAAGRRIGERALRAEETLHAPHLLDLELVNALRSLTVRGVIGESATSLAFRDYLGLQILRYPHDGLLPRIWELRDNLTPYDAAYVALAEMLDAPLITCDARLASALGHGARIELL